jgi:Type IV secretion system pilin
MPSFIKGIDSALDTIATWMLYIVPAILVLTFIIGGIMLSKADDPMDVKKVKDKMKLAIIGAAIAGGGSWIGNWLWGLFT